MSQIPAVSVRLFDLGHGVNCLDTELQRPGLASCYLLVDEGEAAFIDCGTANSLPLLLAALRRKGLDREAVRYVIPTHVHLDHAGGAGALMAACSQASMLVHPRGARHMIDPGKLQQGAEAVYGKERFAALFGELQAVPEQRVISAGQGQRFSLGKRELEIIDTPGHARHHFCIHDPASNGIFTGDTFGASYPELNSGRARFIFPPTTPIQFDPEAWLESLDKLMALTPQRMYLTHFGMQEEPEPLAALLRQFIEEYADLARERAGQEQRQAVLESALMQHSINYLLDQQCGHSPEQIRHILAMDMALNAQGLDHWLSTQTS
jgi:glyoxylase-like metal-dependent hydrolase (beta-lactamase superfamily II)